VSGEAPPGAVFLTGATGFIGRHLLRALLAEGRPITALCRNPRAVGDLVHPLLSIVPGAMEDASSWQPHFVAGMTVYHLAAVRAFPGISPERFRAVNVEATRALGRAALEAGVGRFVYVSSALAYGPSGGRRRTEGDALASDTSGNRYLQSRVRALGEMKVLASAGLPVVTACPSIVYGPDHPLHPNLLTSHMRRLLRFRTDVLVGGGGKKRSLAFVGDVVRGLLLAERFGVPGESYILSGEDVSHRELDRLFLELAGLEMRFSSCLPMPLALSAARLADRLRGFDGGAGYASALEVLGAEWCYDSGKAAERFGYAPISLAEGIGRTLRWLGGAAARKD
jgi:nucleoside-diphosphate-sugar epimerase